MIILTGVSSAGGLPATSGCRLTALGGLFAPLRLLALGSVLAALACGAAPERSPGSVRAPESGELRVLVYNIHAGRDAAGVENLERVAALLLETGADVVLLQEVDRETRRSGLVDQLAELRRATGYHGAFGRTLDYQGGEYGIAVLSRWPILSDTLIPLPIEPAQERAGGSYEPRGAQVVMVQAPGGTMAVLNTHLDASRDDHYRRQEVTTVRRLADRLRETHGAVVVGGDFNAEPGTAPMAHMLEGGWNDSWAACGAGDGRTFPADAPVKRIDYLFIAPDMACTAARVLQTTTSDHRPLLVTLTRQP